MNNQEQLLALKETTNRLESQIKTYEEQEEELITKLYSIRSEKRSLNNLFYKISNIYLKTLLEEENLNLYRYKLSTDYFGTDTIGYVLVKKGIDPEIKYADVLKELAINNLYYYGYVTEDYYYRLAEELDIYLDDEKAVENSELANLEISNYYYSIELVTNYSNLNIDIKKIERWY